MTALTRSAGRQLSPLQLRVELDNLSESCRIMGYHRATFSDLPGAKVGAALADNGRGFWYVAPAEFQSCIDGFLPYCDLEPSYQGYRLREGTPAQALQEAQGAEEFHHVANHQPETNTP